MSRAPHSVRRHLRLEIDDYDATIRRWIPGYERMSALVADEVRPLGAAHVVDLGAGTGALSEVILRTTEAHPVELVDVDPEMLARARVRLEGFGSRVRFREASFFAPLPACDAVVAQIALHHIPEMDTKRELYGRIRDALRPGGVFVNADCVMPAEPEARDAAYHFWAAHMERHGIPERRAYELFAEWAEEDTYFPVEEELAALADAGFDARCVWHEGPMAVVVARR